MASRRELPFRYPKRCHRRQQQPPLYSRYQTYKRHLRVEFEQKCIYCRRPDSVHPQDYKSFAVEHYRPKERFPELICDYRNLFYACAMCNSYKGDYWHDGVDAPFFPNPCDHVMMEHVRFVDGRVEPQSRHGAFMDEALRLNDDAVVLWRRAHVWTVRALEKEVAELKLLRKRLRKQAEGEDAAQDLADIDDKLAEHNARLDCLCGETVTALDLPRSK